MPKPGRDLDKRDPKVTDLRRYRREREKATRKPAKPGGGGLLGSNPRAGLILALVLVVIVALYVLPRFL
jgi:hypothetical protein